MLFVDDVASVFVHKMCIRDSVYYDPWDADLNADPYPMFKRLRDDAPLYYNEPHDFYALSRFDDVNRALVDNQTFSSAKGVVLEILKSGMEIPPGTLIFEDPPIHDIHRNLLSLSLIHISSNSAGSPPP